MLSHLTLYDYRDLDLMLKLAHEMDATPDATGVTATDMAASLGLPEEGGPRTFAARARWMREYGLLDLDPVTRMWKLTRSGARIVRSHEEAALNPEIGAVPDEQLVDVMAHVTKRYRRHGDDAVAHMLRREFLYGTTPRSRAYQNGRRAR